MRDSDVSVVGMRRTKKKMRISKKNLETKISWRKDVWLWGAAIFFSVLKSTIIKMGGWYNSPFHERGDLFCFVFVLSLFLTKEKREQKKLSLLEKSKLQQSTSFFRNLEASFYTQKDSLYTQKQQKNREETEIVLFLRTQSEIVGWFSLSPFFFEGNNNECHRKAFL